MKIDTSAYPTWGLPPTRTRDEWYEPPVSKDEAVKRAYWVDQNGLVIGRNRDDLSWED